MRRGPLCPAEETIHMKRSDRPLKALILTYYFPPSTATAGYRPYAWARALKTHGIKPTVVTRSWRQADGSRESFSGYDETPAHELQAEGYNVHVLPYLPTQKRQIAEQQLKAFPVLRRAWYMLLGLAGEFNIDMDARTAFKSFVWQHLQQHTYDVVIVTTPPFNLIHLAHEIQRRFGIRYIVDFRDLWDNGEMQKSKPVKQNFLLKLVKGHIARWIQKASLITVATPPMADFIKGLGYKGPVHVLLNGFEADLYTSSRHSVPTCTSVFTISCIGNLYPEQDLSVFIGGFNQFIEAVPDAEVSLRFIGLAFNQQMADRIYKEIPEKYLHITSRIAREEAIAETLKADVLFYAGWKGYEGILTTKIFDYIGAHRNILIAPGDQSSIDALIKETGAGVIANSPPEVCTQLICWYTEWKERGSLHYDGNKDLINTYTREAQTAAFAALIKQNIA